MGEHSRTYMRAGRDRLGGLYRSLVIMFAFTWAISCGYLEPRGVSKYTVYI